MVKRKKHKRETVLHVYNYHSVLSIDHVCHIQTWDNAKKRYHLLFPLRSENEFGMTVVAYKQSLNLSFGIHRCSMKKHDQKKGYYNHGKS